MESPGYKAAMPAIDRLLNEIDGDPSKERAAILHALIENQEAVLTEELQQYRRRRENLFWGVERLLRAESPSEILPNDGKGLQIAVADSAQDFLEE